MKLKALLTALCLAGVTASIALADDGHNNGGDKKKQSEHSVAASTTSTTTGATTTTSKHDGEQGKKDSKSTTCRPSIELNLRGTVAATPTAASLALLVSKGGGEGASLTGKQLTLDVAQATKPTTLKSGDAVRVDARACIDLVAGTVKLVASRVRLDGDASKSTSSTTTTTTTTSSSSSTTSSTTPTTTR